MKTAIPLLRSIVPITLLVAVFFTLPQALSAGQIDAFLAGKLTEASPMEKVQVIVYMRDQVDLTQVEQSLRSAVPMGGRVPVELRYRTVLDALQTVADRTQPGFLERIQPYESAGLVSRVDQFWIRNIVVLSATPQAIMEIAGFPEVGEIFYDGLLLRDLPVEGPNHTESSPESSEPGLRAINAHLLWELGYTGEGRLVMGIDTGVNGNNLSFNTRWRGAQPGVPASAAWLDPSGGTTFPVDCDGHGTHTMGTMTGLYTASSETLGVAPAAHWIASNSLCGGGSHTSRSIASFQWAANPDGDPNTVNDVPDAITCSWFDPNVSGTQCEPTAGGYGPVFEAVEALGTAIVFSAGNNGPGASSVTPPKNRIATAADVFSVGAVDGNNPSYPIASFSSRGPSTCSGPDSLVIKPEVSAPGVNVRSASGTNGTAVFSGTSMAAPHVAGAIAVLRGVAPFLTGTEIKYILMSTARDLGTPGEDNTYGHGMIDMWAAYLALPLNLGYVAGEVTSGGSPLSGVRVDFVDSVQQLAGMTNASGEYLASARIDTPNTSAQYTIRAQKFGYIPYTDTVTIVLEDTVTRNISLSPAPGGTLEVHAFRSDSSGIRASVQVIFAGQTVISDSTDETTGLFSTPLPVGTYDVIVDPPSPYGTLNFSNVEILDSQTTTVDAHVRFVVEVAPEVLAETLVVGQVNSQTMTLTNTTSDSVPYRIYDDNVIRRIKKPLTAKEQAASLRSREQQVVVEEAKGSISKLSNPPSTEGQGGPDDFGYRWIDSDEPGGPAYDWVEIKGVGTQITGLGDDTNVGPFPIGFSFPFYGSEYTQIRFCTNGWISFTSTGTTFSNTAIPTTALPNNAIYPFWDDLIFSGTNGATAWRHFDAANTRFIVQFDSVPHFGTVEPGRYTFQVIMYPNGEMVFQYKRMEGTLNSATIGIENAEGTVALQVAFNQAYVHDSLAVRIALPNAAWLSETPATGVLSPSSTQNIQVTFDATDLDVGTTYHALISVLPTHPDVSGTVDVPASLTVEPADSAVMIASHTSMTFPPTALSSTRHDSMSVRNGGAADLVISSITSTAGVFVVSPGSAVLSSGDSLRIHVSYTPTTAGTDTARVIILSNSLGMPEYHMTLSGTGVGVAAIATTPDSIVMNLPFGNNTGVDTLVIGNVGTGILTWSIAEVPTGPAPDPDDLIYFQPEPSLPKGVDGTAGSPVTEGQGGPDAYGYRWIDSDEPGGPTFDWVDISATGQMLDSSSAWVTTGTFAGYDEGYYPVALPFPFNFYGVVKDTVFIGTNGNVMFQRPTGNIFTNAVFPTAGGPIDNHIGVWWDDMMIRVPGKVYYGMDGSNFVITYDSIPLYSTTTWPPNYTFQIIMSPNGTWKTQYLNMSMSGGTLGSSTIGMENATGTIGLGVVHNNATYMHNNLAIRFFAGISWVDTDPSLGSINTNSNQSVLVTFNSAGLASGTHAGVLEIASNDPSTPLKSIPVRLNVGTVSVQEGPGVPTVYNLEQNYPNPFNPTTQIEFGLPEQSDITLRIYDVLGREVRSLAKGTQDVGYFKVEWDGRNSSGTQVSSGLYFYRLEATGATGRTFVSMKKMLLMK